MKIKNICLAFGITLLVLFGCSKLQDVEDKPVRLNSTMSPCDLCGRLLPGARRGERQFCNQGHASMYYELEFISKMMGNAKHEHK